MLCQYRSRYQLLMTGAEELRMKAEAYRQAALNTKDDDFAKGLSRPDGCLAGDRPPGRSHRAAQAKLTAIGAGCVYRAPDRKRGVSGRTLSIVIVGIPAPWASAEHALGEPMRRQKPIRTDQELLN